MLYIYIVNTIVLRNFFGLFSLERGFDAKDLGPIFTFHGLLAERHATDRSSFVFTRVGWSWSTFELVTALYRYGVKISESWKR